MSFPLSSPNNLSLSLSLKREDGGKNSSVGSVFITNIIVYASTMFIAKFVTINKTSK